MEQGFSLIEVVIALLLVTTTSLMLLTHEWQASQQFNHIKTCAHALIDIANNKEQMNNNG